MAMVAVMGAPVGAAVWVAIRIENGLDARTRPGRGPAGGRRCTSGMTAGSRAADPRLTPPAARSGITPGTPRQTAQLDGLSLRYRTARAGQLDRPRARRLTTAPPAGLPGHPRRDGLGGAHRKRRRLVLAICCMSLFIVGLDVTIVNVALPTIQQDFHASLSGLQWIMDGYTLVLAWFLMLAGSTADRLGRRRIFRTGLLLFTLGSLLCSLAPGWAGWSRSDPAGARRSMLNPVAMSIITNTFTDPKERARAIGVWGAVFGVHGARPGPRRHPGHRGRLARDLLGQHPGRHRRAGADQAVRAGVQGAAGAPVRPGRPGPGHRGPRLRTSGIIEGPRRGWGLPLIIGLLRPVAAARCATVRTRRAARAADRPALLPHAAVLRRDRDRGVRVPALGGFLFLNALYLQDVRGYTALHAGLLTLPMAAANLVSAPLSGRLVGSRGPRLPLVGASSRTWSRRC